MVRRRSDSYTSTGVPQLQELQKIYPGRLEIIKGDVTSFPDLKTIVCAHSNLELVYHLASQSFVPDSVENPEYTHEVNAGGTLNLLEAVRPMYDPPKIVFASSSEVYGYQNPNELPLDEDSETRPCSPYASSKLYGENLCRNYYENYGVPVVISRAFNHEGVGRGHHFVTASIVRQFVRVKLGETDKIYVGNIEPVRDWSHVSDIVKAYILLGELGEPGETYCIGSGIAHDIGYFIRRTETLLSLEGTKVIRDPLLVRKVDVPRLKADPTKIMELGWKPALNIDDIITEMIAFYMGMTRRQREALEPVHLDGPVLSMTQEHLPEKLEFGVDKDLK